MNRRGFLKTAAGIIIAAPAIVHAANIMRVRPYAADTLLDGKLVGLDDAMFGSGAPGFVGEGAGALYVDGVKIGDIISLIATCASPAARLMTVTDVSPHGVVTVAPACDASLSGRVHIVAGDTRITFPNARIKGGVNNAPRTQVRTANFKRR